MAESVGPAASAPERYQLFEAGRRRAECPLNQLWVHYLGLGGSMDLFTIDAFLHGMISLPSIQQDILANAINEQLSDLYLGAQVPYLHTLESHTSSPDPLTILDELFGRAVRDTNGQS
ncbi:MAG TPA: hypothetical protein VEQ66_12670 [Propionibacteriaceae bacterium]|nr:hypothetical protein [Propionibacteriaceae bacterium]